MYACIYVAACKTILSNTYQLRSEVMHVHQASQKFIVLWECSEAIHIGIGMSCGWGEGKLLHLFHGCKGYELLQHLLFIVTVWNTSSTIHAPWDEKESNTHTCLVITPVLQQIAHAQAQPDTNTCTYMLSSCHILVSCPDIRMYINVLVYMTWLWGWEGHAPPYILSVLKCYNVH